MYSEDGTVTNYDSLEAYFRRNEKFRPVTSEDEIPYAEQLSLDVDESDSIDKNKDLKNE